MSSTELFVAWDNQVNGRRARRWSVVPRGHVNNNPTMHFLTGIPRNTEALSLTEFAWEFWTWDTV